MSMRLGGGKKLERVEKLCPGFKVIAGPFDVAVSSPCWRGEQAQCRAALRLQRAAGVESKIVMWRGEAYVLRSDKGWREGDNSNLVENGLRCPVCGCGPMGSLRALRLHRCRRLPTVVMSGRVYGGRLDAAQIKQAVEAARVS